jgi:hypothetical protein
LFRLQTEGEFDLKAQGKAGSESVEDTKTVKTYEETKPLEKHPLDVRSKSHDGSFLQPLTDVDAFETVIRVKGNVLTKLNFVDKLM